MSWKIYEEIVGYMKKLGVVRFLGTNCDRDAWQAAEVVGLKPEWLWYQDQFNISEYAGIVLPGGFSYGDYLRCGALAAKSPVMNSVIEASRKGIPILGICNGFQILCDAGLLPGVLVENESLKFVDRWVDLKLVNSCTHWSGESQKNCRIPIAHGEGRYYVEESLLKSLYDNEQIWWTYKENPNGSVEDIAGVMNEEKNVSGLMPHPERALFNWMGGNDGINFFESLV